MKKPVCLEDTFWPMEIIRTRDRLLIVYALIKNSDYEIITTKLISTTREEAEQFKLMFVVFGVFRRGIDQDDPLWLKYGVLDLEEEKLVINLCKTIADEEKDPKVMKICAEIVEMNKRIYEAVENGKIQTAQSLVAERKSKQIAWNKVILGRD